MMEEEWNPNEHPDYTDGLDPDNAELQQIFHDMHINQPEENKPKLLVCPRRSCVIHTFKTGIFNHRGITKCPACDCPGLEV